MWFESAAETCSLTPTDNEVTVQTVSHCGALKSRVWCPPVRGDDRPSQASGRGNRGLRARRIRAYAHRAGAYPAWIEQKTRAAGLRRSGPRILRALSGSGFRLRRRGPRIRRPTVSPKRRTTPLPPRARLAIMASPRTHRGAPMTPDLEILSCHLSVREAHANRRSNQLFEERRVVPFAGFEVRQRGDVILAWREQRPSTLPSLAGRGVTMRREPGNHCDRLVGNATMKKSGAGSPLASSSTPSSRVGVSVYVNVHSTFSPATTRSPCRRRRGRSRSRPSDSSFARRPAIPYGERGTRPA